MKFFIIVPVTVFVLTFSIYTSGAPLYQSVPIHLYDCHNLDQLMLRRAVNNARVISGRSRSFQGWNSWLIYHNSISYMFGINSGSKWYYLTEKNGVLRIVKGSEPSRTVSLTDNRLFEVYREVLSRSPVMKHSSSGKFVGIKHGKIKLVDQIMDAAHICLQ